MAGVKVAASVARHCAMYFIVKNRRKAILGCHNEISKL
jgi:hypothetical protein